LKDFFAAGWTLDGLARFHASQRPALCIQSTTKYDEMTRLVGDGRVGAKPQLRDAYQRAFMAALQDG
jgi:hypothetical protein